MQRPTEGNRLMQQLFVVCVKPFFTLGNGLLFGVYLMATYLYLAFVAIPAASYLSEYPELLWWIGWFALAQPWLLWKIVGDDDGTYPPPASIMGFVLLQVGGALLALSSGAPFIFAAMVTSLAASMVLTLQALGFHTAITFVRWVESHTLATAVLVVIAFIACWYGVQPVMGELPGWLWFTAKVLMVFQVLAIAGITGKALTAGVTPPWFNLLLFVVLQVAGTLRGALVGDAPLTVAMALSLLFTLGTVGVKVFRQAEARAQAVPAE